MRKKIFEVFVCMLLIGTCFVVTPNMVSADLVDGDYTYTTSGNPLVATITGYTGSGGEITIPSTLGGYATVEIEDYAFLRHSNIISVTIPASVTAIRDRVFWECSSMTAIHVDPANLNYADVDGVLYDKAITTLIVCPGGKTDVNIPSSVTGIEPEAFYYCSTLTSVTIPNSMIWIGYRAFEYCSSLTTVTIPNSVTTIGVNAFSYCTSLTAINVELANINYASVDGVLYNKAITTLIQCPGGKAGVNIPSGVTTIGYEAFYHCSDLTSVSIPNSVTTIELRAFSFCTSLTTVVIPDSVTTIGDYAFYHCTSLTTVTIGSSVTTIGENAFGGCTSLTTVVIPDSVTTIGDDAFYYCTSLTSVTIGSTVTTIGDKAFSYCTLLIFVTIPNSVTTIGENAFSCCTSLTMINVDLANINYADVDGVLYNKAITTLIQCPGGKTGTVTIPNTVTTIEDDAFYHCSTLTSVTIPNSVITIGESAFGFCFSMIAIDVDESNGNYASIDGVLYNKAITTLIQCPGGKAGTVTIPNTVTTIGGDAFYWCSQLTFVTIPSGVITIGTFAHCSNLTSVTIPNKVTSIVCDGFAHCSSLTSVTIGSSITDISGAAFGSCSSLTSITFLGLVAPTLGNKDGWIVGTPAGIRGHAYAASNFPPPGEYWNGLMMGDYINLLPTADFTYSPSPPTDLDVIQFTDQSTDTDGTITSWSWGFGDGGTSTLKNPTYQYVDDGTYTVTLTVTDDDGATNTNSKSIVIVSPSEEVQNLIAYTVAMNIPKGLKNSLTQILTNIIKSLEHGQINSAINKLNAFIQLVEVQRGKKLTNEQADYLVTAAQTIINQLQ